MLGKRLKIDLRNICINCHRKESRRIESKDVVLSSVDRKLCPTKFIHVHITNTLVEVVLSHDNRYDIRPKCEILTPEVNKRENLQFIVRVNMREDQNKMVHLQRANLFKSQELFGPFNIFIIV